MSNDDKMSRRDFVKAAAAGAAAFSIVPRHVLGGSGYVAPSEKLNIACVGVGGMGSYNISAVAESENIAALCDVDWGYDKVKNIFDTFPNARKFKDYNEMLAAVKDIDAVIVATPDHTHGLIALEAMKNGKHVYVQKPLTRTIYESRVLTEAARKYGVITQMGNQGHSAEGVRLICEWIWDGAIGDVREVQAWTNRPMWPSPYEKPKEGMPVPELLDWPRWLGPAEDRPYHRVYHPGSWRAFWDFGSGALGDMGCHVLDPVFWALKLKYPTSIEAAAAITWSPEWRPMETSYSFPAASIVRYKFAARDGMPACDMTWWDGGLMPPRPAELEPGRQMGDENGGVLFIGDKGTLMCGCYGSGPRLIPETAMRAYKRPEKTIPRVEGSHEMEWVNAIKAGKQPSANFDYAGPFNEAVVMGNLAVRNPGKKLNWDGEKLEFDDAEANKLIKPDWIDRVSLDI